jgi:DNA polymerase-1
LILEVEEDKVMSVAREVKGIMENILKLKVPIIVEAKSGNNWGEMEKIKF